jgi:thiamine biosynthesis lipoprotein
MSDPENAQNGLAALAALGFRRAMDTQVRSEVVPVGSGRFRVTCTRPSMGTLVSITAVDASRDRIQEAAGRAFQDMDRVVGLLNRYDPDSAVSYLNAEGRIPGPPEELSLVLSQALSYHQASGGAFDPTVQPLVDLFRKAGGRAVGSAGKKGAPENPVLPSTGAGSHESGTCPGGKGAGSWRPPSEVQIQEALSFVDASALKLAPRDIRFSRPGMGITLDGAAKGYVVDRMAEVLEAHGLAHFLIDAGGDIRGRGLREDDRPWQVGVRDPGGQRRLPDVISLGGRAVATSGSYELYFDPEGAHHHLVDAGRGASPRHNQSVSVLAPSALQADALATAVFVMPPDEGLAFIDAFLHCACLIVDREGREFRSSRWRRASSSRHSEAEMS